MGFSSSKTFGFGAPALPGSTGTTTEVLTNTGGVVAWGGVAQWVDLLNVDFRTLPDQDFTVDGPVVVGGQTYVVQQTAKLRAGAVRGIRNGVGNYLGAPNYNGAASNCLQVTPALGITWPFSQSPLLPYLKRDTPLRVAAELAFVRGFNVSYEQGFGTGFQDDSITGTNYNSIAIVGCQATAATLSSFHKIWGGGYATGTARSGGFSGLTGIANSDQRTLGFSCPEGVVGGPRVRWLLGTQAQDAIADPGNMLHYGLMDDAGMVSGALALAARQDLSTWGAHLTTYVDTSNDNAYAVISRWRIQARLGVGA